MDELRDYHGVFVIECLARAENVEVAQADGLEAMQEAEDAAVVLPCQLG